MELEEGEIPPEPEVELQVAPHAVHISQLQQSLDSAWEQRFSKSAIVDNTDRVSDSFVSGLIDPKHDSQQLITSFQANKIYFNQFQSFHYLFIYFFDSKIFFVE
jgi:hypothetical protein